MKKIKSYIFLLALCVSVSILQINAANSTTRRKLSAENDQFLKEFIPQAEKANKAVLKERLGIILIKSFYTFTGSFTSKSITYINELAVKYKTDTLQIETQNQYDVLEQLLEKVDAVPIKMITAQAIIESGWGRSNTARKTKNYFGLTQKSKVGYLVTHNESSNTSFYLKSYASISEGIEDYIYILNTHYAYEKFRNLRDQHRDLKEKLNPYELANGVTRYSEMGDKYIAKIHLVLNRYIPENIDAYLSEDF